MTDAFLGLFYDLNRDNYADFSLFNAELKFEHNIHLFKSLSIQPVSRVVDDNLMSFLAIKDIDIHPDYRSQKLLTQLLDILESKSIPVFVDDIINHRLFTYLHDRGYKNLKHNSGYGWKRSMYKLSI
ncbi:hypothetical protein [Serratia sp. Se-RSBMAAmG]|uniref:hypothetical protein n=1 Tax=Serratia sp. Se-RSBMAAmG TaxID=3043305 RepID=UPI0024AFD414|nr:hypothetical protein [Serratia sp. Se-RSBMAAmG]MDI6976190.1 hypothetical protein [Serratia sp. Se-RSBMAAmG]